jgi:hypothetical protein
MGDFLFIKIFINMNIQEHIRKVLKEETKKPKLLSIIEKEGLFQVIQDTGLNIKQIHSKTGELPREIKIQYIKDVIDHFQQLPHELDLTFITGSIPLYINDNDQIVYVEFLSNEDDVLKVHVYTFGEDGEDDYDTIIGDEIDNETLETLVTELSEKLQHDRKRF